MYFYKVITDNGLSGNLSSHVNPESLNQSELKENLAGWGAFIYQEKHVMWEYNNHFLPKLRTAKTFTFKIRESK